MKDSTHYRDSLSAIFTAQSQLVELRGFDVAISDDKLGKSLAEVFDSDPGLPAVIVTSASEPGQRMCLSRGEYLHAIARHLGQELFLPRPIHVLMESLRTPEPPLILNSDTLVQEATRRCLLRHPDLIYEPFLVLHPATSDRPERVEVIDFQDLLMAYSRVSSLRNQQMQNILTTVKEGLMMVDRDYRIAPEYSRATEEIFAQADLANKRFPDVLRAITDDEIAQRSEDYLRTLFNAKVIENLIIKINPLWEIETRSTAADGSVTRRFLRFGFLRSVEDGEIRRVLVRVEDATRQVLLAREVEEQEKRGRQRTELTFHLVRAEPGPLRTFLGNLAKELAAATDLLQLETSVDVNPAEVRHQLFRTIHGLKGEAALLNLPLHQQRLHEFEDDLQELNRADLQVDDLRPLRSRIERVRELVNESAALIEQFRRISTDEKPNDSAGGPDADARRDEPRNDANLVAAADSNSGSGVVAQIQRLVRELCARHNRQASFICHTPESQFPKLYQQLVRDLLIQLVRNSLVHGIEAPDERIAVDKPVVGEIQFAIRDHPGDHQLELIFQDDGRGLDPARLAEKAAQMGLEWKNEDELFSLIFEPGFSTAQSVSQDAGRGIGMDLLRHRIHQVGGLITPFSDPGVFCAFQVLLPRPNDYPEPFATHETADCR